MVDASRVSHGEMRNHSPRKHAGWLAAGLLISLVGQLSADEPVFQFEDVTEAVGLAEPLQDWAFGHGAAWGDINGDGRPDLYLGAFGDREKVFGIENPPIPNQLFLSTPNGFTLSPETSVRFQGEGARTTYAMLVDLDNDGDLDLFTGNHILTGGRTKTRWWGGTFKESVLFENIGDGHYQDATPEPTESGWPGGIAVRDASAVDLDMDGLLDLILTDGNYAHDHDGGGRLIMLANRGNGRFDNVTDQYGLPTDHTPGTGLAIGDVNDDGQLDFFVAQANRMFVSQRTEQDGWRYQEAEAGLFVGPRNTRNAMTCGAAFGDLDGDGKLDLVTTVHATPGQIDVYMNRTTASDDVHFEHVTQQTGLPMLLPYEGRNELPVKGAHVALQDMDYDGRVDIVLAILWTNEQGEDQPVVLQNLGPDEQGVPQFDVSPLDSVAAYAAPAPLADYDRDGRLDMIFVSWFSRDETVGTRLYRNVSPVGQHLAVRVRGDGKHMNMDGIGATVRVYEAGRLNDPEALLGKQDVTTGQGYSGASEPILYFGLGEAELCDVHVKWKDLEATRKNVLAGQMLEISLPDAQP